MRYRIELADGKDLALSVAGSFLTSRQQLLPRATWTPLAGTVFHPSRFRARAGLTYGSERFTLAAFVSHMSGLDDERQAVPVRIPAYAMLDLTRSEEHTSELQSLMRISYAVFCLKKKTTNKT